MEETKGRTNGSVNRRAFLKKGVMAGGGLTIGAGLIGGNTLAFAQGSEANITKGDVAILRFLNAVEQIETDLWLQYAELGGVQDSTIPGANGGNPLYVGALEILDGDMAQYITDNTDDEISHAAFLKAYLESKGAEAVDLSRFATIPGSTAQGSSKKLRLTNLTQLTVDTSFWSRYRSITNPDVDRGAPFVQAVPSLGVGQHTAIPRTDADTAGSSVSSDNTKSITAHLQAIAFTAGFHFAFIEQGGTSLYPTLAQQVSNAEVLRVLLSIGPSETMHFQTWQDKAGNALPISDTDNGPGGTGAKVTFTNLAQAQGETNPESLKGDTLQANLIMPEPTHFLDKNFPPVAIIRPTSTENSGAMAAFNSLMGDGLFIGQKNQEFFEVMRNLAEEADAARRNGNGRDE
jgi:Ferritin-like domain